MNAYLRDLKMIQELYKLTNIGLRRLGLRITSFRSDTRYYMGGLSQEKFATIIDGGANIGQFALGCRKFWPTAKILSIEPGETAFKQLKITADKNNGAIIPLKKALGMKKEFLPLNVSTSYNVASSFMRATEEGCSLYPHIEQDNIELAEVISIDDLIHEYKEYILPPVLLKLDLQGFELLALEGAKSSLDSISAVIIEVNFIKLYHGQPSFESLHDLLIKRGLHFRGMIYQHIGKDFKVEFGDALFVRG